MMTLLFEVGGGVLRLSILHPSGLVINSGGQPTSKSDTGKHV